ncbi:MAG: peptidoglycan editing factor PgeF [Oscillospiraceae bacterium]|nr:peptidoglycan editing factor PgeF [Oscillospiraceae bacterium]
MPIKTMKSGTLEYLISDGIAVPHCFTTRFGGVSRGILESLNIGIHRGDVWENVLKNYDILGKELSFDPEKIVLSHQTHTDIVRLVGEREAGAGLYGPELEECDALITRTPGIALAIFTADCTPILLHDPVTGAVGAAHAGWRGTASAIAGKTVAAMADAFGAKPEDIRAAIGPNIGPCCFQTDADVPQAMLDTFGDAVKDHIRRDGDKYYVNLKEINALVLRRSGVRHVDISRDCTACQPHRFWSHRVTKGERGSQGAIIVCKECCR